jgi:hypothetical protein
MQTVERHIAFSFRRMCLLVALLCGSKFDARGGWSREEVEGICKRSLQTVPLDGIVGHHVIDR